MSSIYFRYTLPRSSFVASCSFRVGHNPHSMLYSSHCSPLTLWPTTAHSLQIKIYNLGPEPQDVQNMFHVFKSTLYTNSFQWFHRTSSKEKNVLKHTHQEQCTVHRISLRLRMTFMKRYFQHSKRKRNMAD